MRLFRCGCSLLPILLLLVGGVVLFNNPRLLPGPLGDFAVDARSSLAAIALGGELSSSDLAVDSVEFDATKGGSLTLTLATTKTKAPTAKELAPAFKALGGHFSGPLPLANSPAAKVKIVVERASDGKRLVTFSASSADLQAYATGKLTSAAFLKRVTVTP